MKKSKSFRQSRGGVGVRPRVFDGRKHITDLYDSNWEKYRYRFLAINPFCYACGIKSQVCDHLVPHKGDEVLFKKTDNHIPLCNRCHNTVTALFDKNYIKGHPIDKKLKWLAQSRINYQCVVRVRVLPTYDI